MDNKITKNYLQSLVKDHFQYDKTIEPIIKKIDKYLENYSHNPTRSLA